MAKTDFKKQFKGLYQPSAKQVVLINVPPMNFLVVDGKGDPNTSESYRNAIEALYSMSYALKFMLKKSKPAVDYVVMPLEGLWWSPGSSHLDTQNKNEWLWTAMIMQPDMISVSQVDTARAEVKRRKDLPALPLLRFEKFAEGRAVQTLHIGPYADEEPTIQRLHVFIQENSLLATGKHHEIYLSDPRRTAPEKLKTVVRQPVK